MIKIVKEPIGFHYLSTKNTNVYFGSFGIEYISLELLNKLKDELVTYNIFRIQDIMNLICVDFVVSLT